MGFLDDNYLLESGPAQELYLHVKDLPIVDIHNHSDIKEIVENKGWNDIWEIEGATDHYVWELMRRKGISEHKITGSATSKEKWMALAEVFPDFAGNPTYEWVHLDLKRRFGINEIISKETAEMIWEQTNKMLKKEEFRPRELLKDMKVDIMCTTEEPTSTLEYHQKAREMIKGIKILPSWRPDRAMNIEKSDWIDFIKQLEEKMEVEAKDLSGFMKALHKSHDYFSENGCIASDHGLCEPFSYPVTEARAANIYRTALAGEKISQQDIKDFKAYMLCQFGEMNKKSGWITQLHIGATRNYRDKLYKLLGSDAGGDIAKYSIDIADNLKYFFNYFDSNLKIVLYYLDCAHLFTITSISRAFPNIVLGAAWWFNDSPVGMEEQLKYISTVDLLSNFAGMVTDSRKLISYGSRTEMFRRVLCNFVAEMSNRGQITIDNARRLASALSYYRPLNLFFK